LSTLIQRPCQSIRGSWVNIVKFTRQIPNLGHIEFFRDMSGYPAEMGIRKLITGPVKIERIVNWEGR